MTTSISSASSPQPIQTAAQHNALQQTVDSLSAQFSSTLGKALEQALQQRQATTTPIADAGQTAARAAAQSTDTTAPAANWQAPWRKGAESAGQYLHGASADAAQRQQGKPDMAQFMQASGCDAATASSLLYGVVGSNQDFRDWNAIMGAADPVLAARQATGALYQSSLPYTDGSGFQPDSEQTLAAAGSFAWLKVEEREGLWLMNSQGEALRQVPLSSPDILRNARDFGLDLNDLSALADQMDAKAIQYAPGSLHPGSDHGVDLRSLARGGLGSTYDWTSDPLAHLKGPGAQAAVAANAQMAREMGLSRTPLDLGLGAVGRPPAPGAAPATGTPTGTATATAPDGATGIEALGKELTDSLLAQFQSTLKGWQTSPLPTNSAQPSA